MSAKIGKCEKCGGRSFMNGFCLTCDHVRANAANRKSKNGGSILAHCEASIRRGFVTKKPGADA